MAPRQHKGRRAAGGSRELADGRKPSLVYSCSRHAATSQPTSGQPFSAARVVRDPAAHPKQDGAAEEKMAPCLLWERLKGFIALGDNSVSTDICAESSFSLSSTLLPLSLFAFCCSSEVLPSTWGAPCPLLLLPVPAGTGLCSSAGTLEHCSSANAVSADADQAALGGFDLQGWSC